MAIHVAITRKILPGQSFIHDGVHGAAIISAFPGAESNEIGILRTFKDEIERDAFYNSEQFKQWEYYATGWFLVNLTVPFRLLITATLMVGILTWIVMPIVTKILKAWLTGNHQN